MGKLGLALIGLTNAWFNKPAEIGAQCVGDNVSNGSDLSADPFTWVGNDVTKAKMHGSNSTKLMVNLNGLKALNGKEAEFVGLIMWSRKTCNQDFIDKVADGTVTFDILDKFDADNSADSYYKTADQFRFKRDDTKFSSITIQFGHSSEDGANTLGNAKKDQFHLLLHGIDQVDFGNKDQAACLAGAMIGWMNVNDGASNDY